MRKSNTLVITTGMTITSDFLSYKISQVVTLRAGECNEQEKK